MRVFLLSGYFEMFQTGWAGIWALYSSYFLIGVGFINNNNNKLSLCLDLQFNHHHHHHHHKHHIRFPLLFDLNRGDSG